MIRSRALGFAGLLVLTAWGCAAPTDEAEGSDEAAVTELKAYWADAKKLDLNDLTRVAAGLATDKLNDALVAGPISATFDPPSVFAATAEPSKVLPDGSEIKALDTIVSGLAARFGESELGTQVNRVRLEHLESRADKYYVESAFAIRGGLSEAWGIQAGGFLNGVGATVGFDAGVELASRVILAADDDHVGSLVRAPLQAAKEMRGFVYPRSVADIRSMKPGEMFALRGLGKLGANFGIGAPILVAEPTAGAVYRVVVSAGVSAVVGGQVDVQLVKLDGDEVVVDVGVENGKATGISASIHDGWGIKGICEDGLRCLRTVEMGPAKVDLSKLVEKAVENRLNSYLSFKLEASATSASSRVSLSRFRFHLDRGDKDEVSRALEQALKLDVRLAQALYNRDLGEADAPVVAELDALRSATTTTRSFGFELLGMNLYHRAIVKNEGTFVVQTPDGARAILFDSLNKHGGWFQMDHGFTRTGVAAQTLDAATPEKFRSEANLFLQTNVGDTHMDNDIIIDNVDAMLVGIVGPQAVEAIDQYGNDMQRLVWSRCPVKEDQQRNTKTWDEQCNVALLDDPTMQDLRAKALGAIEPLIADLPADYQELARKAAGVRVTLQSVGIHNLDALNGPNASFALDVRFDDGALAELTSRSKADYRSALREYLTAVYADRTHVGKDMDKDAVRAVVDDKFGAKMDKMAARFEKQAKAYRLVSDAERLIPVALAGKRFAQYPLGVRFSVDGSENKKYEKAVMLSTSHDRALAAAGLFDGLLDEAGSLHPALYAEHTATFPLLGLVARDRLEVGMDVRADVKSSFWVKRDRYLKAGFTSAAAHAKGADVSTISAGMFDLSAIIAGK
jgi:hypothetical protein